jgi:hypothetical protein
VRLLAAEGVLGSTLQTSTGDQPNNSRRRCHCAGETTAVGEPRPTAAGRLQQQTRRFVEPPQGGGLGLGRLVAMGEPDVMLGAENISIGWVHCVSYDCRGGASVVLHPSLLRRCWRGPCIWPDRQTAGRLSLASAVVVVVGTVQEAVSTTCCAHSRRHSPTSPLAAAVCRRLQCRCSV